DRPTKRQTKSQLIACVRLALNSDRGHRARAFLNAVPPRPNAPHASPRRRIARIARLPSPLLPYPANDATLENGDAICARRTIGEGASPDDAARFHCR